MGRIGYMKYKLTTTARFDKEYKKLDKYTQKLIKNWTKKHIENCDNPKIYGKALQGNKKGFWRYRIGDYRMICIIKDNELIILAITIGHRREIYM